MAAVFEPSWAWHVVARPLLGLQISGLQWTGSLLHGDVVLRDICLLLPDGHRPDRKVGEPC